MSQPEQRVILTYDAAPKRRSPSRRVILGYWGGLGISSVLHGIAIAVLTLNGYREPAFGPIIDGLMFSSVWFLMQVMLATLFLGLSLWIKTKIVKEVDFRRWRANVAWGILGGADLPLLLALHLPDSTLIALAIVVGLWQCIVPVAAGQFLCYRSHLRS